MQSLVNAFYELTFIMMIIIWLCIFTVIQKTLNIIQMRLIKRHKLIDFYTIV